MVALFASLKWRLLTSRLRGVSTAKRTLSMAGLALETLTGTFFDHLADPNPELLERRLKVFRKMLVLFVEYELENTPPPRA